MNKLLNSVALSAFVSHAAVGGILSALAFGVVLPQANAMWVSSELQDAFKEFHATTARSFSDKQYRENRLRAILKEKDAIVAANTWWFMVCEGEFTDRTAGPLYRMDTLTASCRWGRS